MPLHCQKWVFFRQRKIIYTIGKNKSKEENIDSYRGQTTFFIPFSPWKSEDRLEAEERRLEEPFREGREVTRGDREGGGIFTDDAFERTVF